MLVIVFLRFYVFEWDYVSTFVFISVTISPSALGGLRLNGQLISKSPVVTTFTTYSVPSRPDLTLAVITFRKSSLQDKGPYVLAQLDGIPFAGIYDVIQFYDAHSRTLGYPNIDNIQVGRFIFPLFFFSFFFFSFSILLFFVILLFL